VDACASDREEAPDIALPVSARAPLLCTDEAEARMPEADGTKAPLAPDPETVVDALRALADPDAWLAPPAGLLRAVPCALLEACAMDWEAAPDMDWLLESARALLLCTAEVEARAPELEGVNAVLAPVADAVGLFWDAALEAEAADCAPDDCGLLRAAFNPVADCEMDCEVAEAIFWLVSARAPVAATEESTARALEAEGAMEALAPEALKELGVALLAAEADWAEASCGVLLAALLPIADWAVLCELGAVIC
tara:strand:+ start:14815 stop:15573 length:759 start_codon:yes stop_codon:yes gene_type:complete